MTKPAVKPQEVRNTSQSFFEAFLRCMERRPTEGGGISMPVVPGVVCVTFAAEVGLKAVLIAEGASSPWTHDLEALFFQLSVEAQLTIIAKSGYPPPAFHDLLKDHALAFEEMRYIYEPLSQPWDESVQRFHHADIDFLANLAAATNLVPLDRDPATLTKPPQPQATKQKQRKKTSKSRKR